LEYDFVIEAVAEAGIQLKGLWKAFVLERGLHEFWWCEAKPLLTDIAISKASA